MKVSSKEGLQQITFKHSQDIEFRNFMNLYKKRAAKPYSFLMINAILASDNLLRFKSNILEKIQNQIKQG